MSNNVIPKSKSLLRDQIKNEAQGGMANIAQLELSPPHDPTKPIKIREVKCYNDFVAILQFRIQSSSIELPGASALKNEGMVVGVGPGIPTANGARCPSQLNLGDVVTFYGNPATALEANDGFYKGQRIILISERSVICALSPVAFECVK